MAFETRLIIICYESQMSVWTCENVHIQAQAVTFTEAGGCARGMRPRLEEADTLHRTLSLSRRHRIRQ